MVNEGYTKEELTSHEENTFSLNKYLKSITLPNLCIFLLSFVFLFYSFDLIPQGLIISVILSVLAFLVDFSYKKNKVTLRKGITIFGLIVLIAYSFNLKILCAIIIFLAVHSGICFFKSKKKYPLESIFLTLLISFTISFAISFLIYLIYAYVVFAFIGEIQPFTLNFIMFPLYVSFIFSYLLISANLFRKSFGRFDCLAYGFRDERDTKKTIVKTTITLSLTLLVIIQIITLFLGIALVNKIIFFQENTAGRMLEIPKNVYDPEDTELQNSEVLTQLNNLWRANREMIINKSERMIIKPKNWQGKLSLFFTGKIYDNLIAYLLSLEGYMESKLEISQSMQIISQEYKWIKRNLVNGTLFYDGTKTLQAHLQKLQSNNNQMFLLFLYLEDQDKRKCLPLPASTKHFFPEQSTLLDKLPIKIDEGYGSLFDKASIKIIKHLDAYKAIERLSTKLCEYRRARIKKINLEYYKSKGWSWGGDDINKTLKLKILETKIANLIIHNCKTTKCKMEIISLVKNPDLCSDLDYMDRDRCKLLCSTYNREICNQIIDGGMRNRCRDPYPMNH